MKPKLLLKSGAPPRITQATISAALKAKKSGRDSAPSGIVVEILKAGDFVTEVRIITLANVTNERQIPFDYKHSGIKNYIKEDSSY